MNKQDYCDEAIIALLEESFKNLKICSNIGGEQQKYAYNKQKGKTEELKEQMKYFTTKLVVKNEQELNDIVNTLHQIEMSFSKKGYRNPTQIETQNSPEKLDTLQQLQEKLENYLQEHQLYINQNAYIQNKSPTQQNSGIKIQNLSPQSENKNIQILSPSKKQNQSQQDNLNINFESFQQGGLRNVKILSPNKRQNQVNKENQNLMPIKNDMFTFQLKQIDSQSEYEPYIKTTYDQYQQQLQFTEEQLPDESSFNLDLKIQSSENAQKKESKTKNQGIVEILEDIFFYNQNDNTNEGENQSQSKVTMLTTHQRAPLAIRQNLQEIAKPDVWTTKILVPFLGIKPISEKMKAKLIVSGHQTYIEQNYIQAKLLIILLKDASSHKKLESLQSPVFRYLKKAERILQKQKNGDFNFTIKSLDSFIFLKQIKSFQNFKNAWNNLTHNFETNNIKKKNQKENIIQTLQVKQKYQVKLFIFDQQDVQLEFLMGGIYPIYHSNSQVDNFKLVFNKILEIYGVTDKIEGIPKNFAFKPNEVITDPSLKLINLFLAKTNKKMISGFEIFEMTILYMAFLSYHPLNSKEANEYWLQHKVEIIYKILRKLEESYKSTKKQIHQQQQNQKLILSWVNYFLPEILAFQIQCYNQLGAKYQNEWGHQIEYFKDFNSANNSNSNIKSINKFAQFLIAHQIARKEQNAGNNEHACILYRNSVEILNELHTELKSQKQTKTMTTGMMQHYSKNIQSLIPVIIRDIQVNQFWSDFQNMLQDEKYSFNDIDHLLDEIEAKLISLQKYHQFSSWNIDFSIFIEFQIIKKYFQLNMTPRFRSSRKLSYEIAKQRFANMLEFNKNIETNPYYFNTMCLMYIMEITQEEVPRHTRKQLTNNFIRMICQHHNGVNFTLDKSSACYYYMSKYYTSQNLNDKSIILSMLEERWVCKPHDQPVWYNIHLFNVNNEKEQLVYQLQIPSSLILGSLSPILQKQKPKKKKLKQNEKQ